MALSIIRIVTISVSSIKILFTDDLDDNIGINNISIVPSMDSINTPTVVSVEVSGDLLTVNYTPLFPNVQYALTFFSTTSQPFATSNGERITEDGNRNKLFITSPGEENHIIRDKIIENIPEGVYNFDEPTILRNLVTSISNEIQKGKDALDTVRSSNYVSILVEDELVVRSDGPTDKLINGGAFEILRVASTPTGSGTSTEMEFNSTRTDLFKVTPSTIVNSVIGSLSPDPISLLSTDIINETVSDNSDDANSFNGMLIKVANRPIIQLISLTLIHDDDTIEYDVERFGYTLKDNRYDTNSASINVNLNDNEIELSLSSLTGQDGGFIKPRPGDEIRISYIYKNLGRNIVADSVILKTVKETVRELTPAIVTRFSLKNAPIVLSTGVTPITGGVEFLNTQATDDGSPFATIHPAFNRELVYDILRLPSKIGEYSINYATGEVFVFGEDSENSGTGENPPVANYYYEQIFEPNLDYTFNSDRDELAIYSVRNIDGIDATIVFKYEDTFAKDEDFRVLSHVEVLNERINNRLVGDFQLKVNNAPIFDVFRIFNETTGELYSPVRFNDTVITFTGRQAPRQRDINRERAAFERVPQEILYIADELENDYSLRILKIELANNGIVASQGKFIGANFSTSILFSRKDLFIREWFYEDRLFTSVDNNINRLLAIGDYCVDYTNGIIYVAVSATQTTDLGDISYQHKHILTKNTHILGVNNIYRSTSSNLPNVKTFGIGAITDTTADILGLEQIGERFIENNPLRPIIVGSYQNGEDGVTVKDSMSFMSNSAIFTTEDIGRTLTVGTSEQTPVEQVTITGLISNHEVLVSAAFSITKGGRIWDITDLSEGAEKIITLNNDIVSVQNIYSVQQLGTMPFDQLDGYFVVGRDVIEGNTIILGESNPLNIGDAIIVVYNYGEVYIDYRHLRDNIIVSYEYGNNSLDWSISTKLLPGTEYFVTYKYGALRDALLLNFGSLTQIKELTTFSPNLNRETYRSIIGGTLQSFLTGPTIPSISNLVKSFTDVKPNINELAFTTWVLGRDHLHLRPVESSTTPLFDLGRFNNGIVLDSGQYLKVSALSHVKLNEGTIEAWVRPQWKGLSNDATLSFDLSIDGYQDPTRVFIGFAGINPSSIPFTLNTSDIDISVFNTPSNIDDDTGYFIWFDESASAWNIRWKEDRTSEHEFTGTITTSGEFYNVAKPLGPDGYEINEVTDIMTSTIKSISFDALIDGYDEMVHTEINAIDGISFSSGDVHYLLDMAQREDANRVSIFKDGTGYLNFQVWDHRAIHENQAGFYNMSTNIRNWEANELHHIAVSWKFNTVEEKDEMHLFIDGSEVPNLFKYGGNPKASSSFDYNDIANEYVITNSIRPIVGGFDGITTASSSLFISENTDFATSGIQVGDQLYVIGDIPDGDASPNFSAPYNIIGVGDTTLLLDRSFTTTLSSVQFSVNQVVATVDTPINFQDFIMVNIDADGNETELNGVDASQADYSVRRGNDHSHVITINNGVPLGSNLVIRPLGLIFRRCKERVFVYGETDLVRLNAAAPVTLDDVNITKIIIPRTLISTGGGFGLVGTIVGAQLVTLLQSFFEQTCQPSNRIKGRKLSVYLSGDNINYDIPGNQIIITGETYSGATQETLLFTENDIITTSEYWKTIDSITVSVIPIDATQAIGVVEVREYKPINVSENNGDFAEIMEYSNGLFRLETYGTGGTPFLLETCLYEVDYPSFLRIRLDGQPDLLFIGSDHTGSNIFDGTIDTFRVLDYMSEDTRIGEVVAAGARSITTDYNAPQAFSADDNSLLLLNLDNNIADESLFIDRFDSGFEITNSVNDEFKKAIKLSDRAYIVDNAGTIFNNREGTIEFWVSPFDDSKNNTGYNYYLDMSAVVIEEVTSSTSVTLKTSQRIRTIESVRLATDSFNAGTNYFTGGSISNIDKQTVVLGTPLPTQNTAVKVSYVPLNSQGDRVSIFRDPSGYINFFMKASGVEHLITVPIAWTRHTWHRVMVMWKTNSASGEDRLRLFVDGVERGTIRYGTGLLYGDEVIYGQEEVRSGSNRFLVDNIDLVDTFARIYIGGDVYDLNHARSRIDNIRFSDVERLQAIKVTSSGTLDVNHTANTEFAIPVVEDLNTTAIFDFDKSLELVEFLATVINAERGIFRFEVEVIDSFNKVIGNTELEDLLVKLVNVIKPAHTEAIIIFKE